MNACIDVSHEAMAKTSFKIISLFTFQKKVPKILKKKIKQNMMRQKSTRSTAGTEAGGDRPRGIGGSG